MRRRGRPIPEPVLTGSERAALEQWMPHRTTAQALALRARIVLGR